MWSDASPIWELFPYSNWRQSSLPAPLQSVHGMATVSQWYIIILVTSLTSLSKNARTSCKQWPPLIKGMVNYTPTKLFVPLHFLVMFFPFPFNSFSFSFDSLSFLSFPFHVIFISAHFLSFAFICFHFLLFPFDILVISFMFAFPSFSLPIWCSKLKAIGNYIIHKMEKWGGAGGRFSNLRSTLLAVGLLPRNASYSSITKSMCRGIGSGASPIGYAGFINY